MAKRKTATVARVDRKVRRLRTEMNQVIEVVNQIQEALDGPPADLIGFKISQNWDDEEEVPDEMP
jgi:hypothetical protein